MSQLKKVFCLLAAAGLGLSVSMVTLADRSQEIAERIKPAGNSCMEGEACAAAPVAAVASGPRTGEQVYSTKCVTCHGTGAAGAPKMGDAGQWAPRLGQGMDSLYANAINGLNGMPAKGLCMDCSDDEIKAAVDHILAASK